MRHTLRLDEGGGGGLPSVSSSKSSTLKASKGSVSKISGASLDLD